MLTVILMPAFMSVPFFLNFVSFNIKREIQDVYLTSFGSLVAFVIWNLIYFTLIFDQPDVPVWVGCDLKGEGIYEHVDKEKYITMHVAYSCFFGLFIGFFYYLVAHPYS